MPNYFKAPKAVFSPMGISEYFGGKFAYHLYDVHSDRSAMRWALELEQLLGQPFFRIEDERITQMIKKKESIITVSRYFTQKTEEPPYIIVLIDFRKEETNPVLNFDNYNFLFLLICNKDYSIEGHQQKISQLFPDFFANNLNEILHPFIKKEHGNDGATVMKKEPVLPKDENTIFLFNMVNGSLLAVNDFSDKQRNQLLYSDSALEGRFPFMNSMEKNEEYLSFLQKDVSYE